MADSNFSQRHIANCEYCQLRILPIAAAAKTRIVIPHHGASPGARHGAGLLLSALCLAPVPAAGLGFSGLARGLALKTFQNLPNPYIRE